MPFRRRSTSFGRNRGFYPPPSKPRPVKDGLQTKSKRGAIGETWWSRRFIEVLEDFHEGSRLSRGRAYARRGQVVDMELEAGEVSARVQGSRARPYDIRISVPVLEDAEWARVEEALAGRAVFLARLLAGEMPNEIEGAFAATNLSLFPASADDLVSDCSCPDWENPCKHIAAVYYLLAEAFDRDPFLILAWRGRPRERLLGELRALRGQAASPGPGAVGEPEKVLPEAASWLLGFLDPAGVDLSDAPPETTATRFWEPGSDFAAVRVEPRAVAMPEAILRELEPSGLSVGGRPLEDLLTPAYREIAAAAVRLADGEALEAAPLRPNPLAAPEPDATKPRGRARSGPKRGPSRERLEQLVQEATVDCFDESEACTGLFEMIHEHLEIPFVTVVLGVAVTVTALDITGDNQIVAVCRRGRDLLRIALLELPMPDPRPPGADWVDAYRHWVRN